MSRRFLKKCPSWEELKSVRGQTLRKFYYANQGRSEQRIQERLDLHRASRALCTDAIALELGRMQTLSLIEQLESIDKIIHEYDKKINWQFRALIWRHDFLAIRLWLEFIGFESSIVSL